MSKNIERAINILIVVVVGPALIYFSLIYDKDSTNSKISNEVYQERVVELDEELMELREQANIKMEELENLEAKFEEHKEEQNDIFKEIDKAIEADDNKKIEVLLSEISVNDGFTGNFIKLIDNKQEVIIQLGDQIQQLLEERHQLTEEVTSEE